MAIKIQGQTVIDNDQNINVTGAVTATSFQLSDGSSISGSASITVSETAPATASLDEGSLWWNSSSDDASLYVLYADPDTAAKQWIEASPATSTVDMSVYNTATEVDSKIASAALSLSSLPTLP